MIGRRTLRAARLAVALLAGGCATAPAPTGTLNATLWVQSAAEYRAVAEQTYRAATAALERALADSGWTASVEQTRPYAGLPSAVIVDVDETVLDNSPFDARAIVESEPFDPEAWAAWVRAADAEPVPGAREFARAAAETGVTVFYVTNRAHELEAATRENLAAAGFPLAQGRDVILTRGEREGWTRDKASRREAVADSFRVLLLVGDDLNDFVSARASAADRAGIVRRHEDRWGERWFVLPNPIYGSWEEAAIGFGRDLSPEQERDAKIRALEAWDGP